MKEGFTVVNLPICVGDNCILVDNYLLKNRVSNIPLELIQLKQNKDERSIGVWKIKSLKN